jgi:hypothetical protein
VFRENVRPEQKKTLASEIILLYIFSTSFLRCLVYKSLGLFLDLFRMGVNFPAGSLREGYRSIFMEEFMINVQRSLGVTMTSALLSVLLCISFAQGQTDVENALKQYDAVTVRGYIQPLADLYGANISTGNFHDAYIPHDGFTFHLDFIGMGSLVSDDRKTYTVTLPAGFTQRTTVQPTILGPVATLVKDPSGFQYKGSDGMVDASLFSHGVAQLTLGSVAGTEAYGRFFTTPAIGKEKFPKTTLYGGGARHSVSQYLKDPPIDIAAGFSYNHMTIGDIMEINALLIGAEASKNWGVFGLYGGLAWEKSTLKLNYTPSDGDGSPVAVELDGANKVRFTGGWTITLGFFRIFADANIGSLTTVAAGIGFGTTPNELH